MFIFALENGLIMFLKHFKNRFKSAKINKIIDNNDEKEENYSDSPKKRGTTRKSNEHKRDNSVQCTCFPFRLRECPAHKEPGFICVWWC